MSKSPLVSPKLEASAFTATKFSTAAEKAKFGNELLTFIAAGFPRQKFTKAFYRRLVMTFGHIAHFDEHGFWEHFFTSTAAKIRFLEETLAWHCYGQPEYTFCDVERAVQQRLHAHPQVMEGLRTRLASETRDRELTLLAELKAKHPDAA